MFVVHLSRELTDLHTETKDAYCSILEIRITMANIFPVFVFMQLVVKGSQNFVIEKVVIFLSFLFSITASIKSFTSLKQHSFLLLLQIKKRSEGVSHNNFLFGKLNKKKYVNTYITHTVWEL